jgi:hypothetical protein
MKKKVLLAATLLGFLSITNLNAQTQNQSDGFISQPTISAPTIANEVFRFKQGLVSHLLNGNLPTSGGLGFTGNDRWITQGEVTVPTQTLYGTRTQINGRGLVMGYSLSNISGLLSDPIIQWGGNAGFGVSPGDLRFRSFQIANSPGQADEHLTLRSNGTSYFGRTPATTSAFNPWVDVVTFNENNLPIITGLAGSATNLSPSFLNGSSIGLQGTAIGQPIRFDLFTGFTIGSATGVFGEAQGGFAIGVNGTTIAGSSLEIGVYGTTASGLGAAAQFNGDTYCTSGFWAGSDKKLKKDIKTETNALKIISQLNPVSYLFNREDNKWINLNDKKQHGFISQEVEEILPELVKEVAQPVFEEGKSGKVERVEKYKSINYNGFIAILTKAIQEQQEQIDELKNQLANKNNNEVFVVTEKLNTEEAKQIAAKSYVLAQNVPNPFYSSTTIKYKIPESKTATIAVFDLNGKLLLQYPNLKGNAQLTINGSTLQAGMYLYSLLVNGEEIVTKKMILTK